MTRVLRALLRLVFVNFWWKLLSLVIAFAIWATVASEPEMETSVSVPLEYRNLPEGLEVSNVVPGNNLVSLELRGPSGELRGLGESGGLRPAIVLDMSRLRPGQRTFTIGEDNVKLPRGVTLVWARPSVVRFDFENSDAPYVPVSVRFTGEGANGYVVARYAVSPKELRIVGPKSHVERITSVVTDPVDVSGVVAQAEFRVNAFVNDSYVRFQSTPQVTVTVKMKKASR